MQNQGLSGYVYAIIAVTILAVVAIAMNGYCIYIFLKKNKCRCQQDAEKNPTDLVNESSQSEDDSTSKTAKAEIDRIVENLERVVRNNELQILVEKMEKQQMLGSYLTSHVEDNHENVKISEKAKSTEYQPIPTNVNSDGIVIPTVWKESFAKKI